MTETKAPFGIAELLAAVEATSSEMSAMDERITSLESVNYRMEEENKQLRSEVTDMIERVQAAQASSEAATQSADTAEASSAAYQRRAAQLQSELRAANDDIARISGAVSDVLARFATGR